MRGHAEFDKSGKITSGGTLVFYFDRAGHALRLDFYKNWLAVMGPEMKPGTHVECICPEDALDLDCPIHSADLGPDFEGF